MGAFYCQSDKKSNKSIENRGYMTKPLTPQKAASKERDAIRAKLIREAKNHRKMGFNRIAEYLEILVDWLNTRDDRFNKKAGGLGK